MGTNISVIVLIAVNMTSAGSGSSGASVSRSPIQQIQGIFALGSIYTAEEYGMDASIFRLMNREFAGMVQYSSEFFVNAWHRIAVTDPTESRFAPLIADSTDGGDSS